MDEKPNYMTVKQLAEKYKAFSEANIRWLIFNSANNGFKECFRKIGKKRILIREDLFIDWIENFRQ